MIPQQKYQSNVFSELNEMHIYLPEKAAVEHLLEDGAALDELPRLFCPLIF